MLTKVAEESTTPSADLQKITRMIQESGGGQLANAIPMPIMLLDMNRQIVFANRELLHIVHETDVRNAIGKRPGDLLSCVHATSCPAGCGHTEYCTQCGAIEAILLSMRGQPATRQCHMLRRDEPHLQALDLEISSSPTEMKNIPLIMVSIKDVSDEIRRGVLERLFFHDILNMAGSLKSLMDILAEQQHCDPTHTLMEQGFTALLEEIKSHQALTAAETGQLPVQIVALDSLETVRDLADRYRMHLAAHDKHIAVSPDSVQMTCYTDKALLHRVLGNMLKNALEASPEGATVTIGCIFEPGSDWPVVFHVHNPGAMPPSVALQVFNRSFSTKGSGRGLGTYSIKLFTERYLGGTASLSSSEAGGTIFRAALPLRLPD